MEAVNSSLKKELHELRDKLDNSQLQEQSEICSLSTQLAACNAKLALEAGEKERIKAKMEAFKGNLSCAVIQISTPKKQFRRKPRRSV